MAAVWMPSRVSLDDSRWRLVDLACGGCTVPAFNYMQRLLEDPENDDRPIRDLLGQVQEFEKKQVDALLTPLARKKQAEFDPTDDPTLDCTPEGDGLQHQIMAPLPFQIERSGDEITLRYEYWNAVRTVYMDGRDHPADGDLTRLGHSTGKFDGETLVVETVDLIPNMIGLPGGAIRLGRNARALERYKLNDDGNRLDLELSIMDPENFREPYVEQRSTLLTPGWELDEFICEATTGEF